MIIDLVKIGNIKTLDELKEYPLDEPYFYNNYLFHYLIITNNLNTLKLHNFPVQIVNEDGYNGFMLAAKYNYYDTIDYLLSKYSKYLNITNKFNENMLHFLDPTLDEYSNFIIKNKSKFMKLYYSYDINGVCPLDYLFGEGSLDNILKINKEIDFNYNNYTKTPFHFNIILNKSLTSKDIIKVLQLLYKKDNNIFSYIDNEGNNILFPIVLDGKYKLLQYLNDLNKNHDIIKFDYYTPINTFHIFKTAYNKGIVSNNYQMADYILNNIIKNHNFEETDKYGNNLAHFILSSRIKNKRGNRKIEEKILKKYKGWDNVNVKNETPRQLINKIGGNYKKFLSYKGRDNSKNKSKKNSRKKSRKSSRKSSKSSTKEDNNINLDENKYEYTHSNKFQARFTDIAIFFDYIRNKYKNVYIPTYDGKYNSKEVDEDLIFPDGLLYKYNNFPWLLVWNNKNNYFIHPKLNMLIKKNKKKYDIAVLLLSMRLPNGGLHATLVIYDFKRNIIERFDPYGNTTLLDKDIDIVFKKELTYGKNVKYCDTSCYFPVAGFQTISNEENMYNQKMGDFGGYCLAWCLWYIEHRLKNLKANPKMLVRKTLHKIMEMKLKPDEYIRNYANNINNVRVDYMKKIGIPENVISNEMMPNNYIKILNDSIIKLF
tara:strand:- start:1179 stop:3140 length:1962 start_codon:yes stop_codon:yes gene_type:complete